MMPDQLDRILREIDARQSAQVRRLRVRPPKWGEQSGGAAAAAFASLQADPAVPGALQWPPPKAEGWSAGGSPGGTGGPPPGGADLQARLAAIRAGMAALQQSQTPEGGAAWLRSLPAGYGLVRAKGELRQRSGSHPNSNNASRYAGEAMARLSVAEEWRLATLGEKVSNVMPLLPIGSLLDLLSGRPVKEVMGAPEATAGVPDEQEAARLRLLRARSEAAIAERHRRGFK